MKLDTLVLIAKGASLLVGAVAASLAGGLGETGMTVLWGFPIKFWQLVFGAISVGCNVNVGFLSTSFGNYMIRRNGGAKPRRR